MCGKKYGGVFVSLENFSLVWRRHHCWWRAANFDLCSALLAIEQWGFFSVLHLLWHGASVYNSPRTRGTRTYSRVFGSGAVTTCFKDMSVPTVDQTTYYDMGPICEGSSACHTYFDTGPLGFWRFFSVPHLLWHRTSVFVKVLQRATLTMTRDLGICGLNGISYHINTSVRSSRIRSCFYY